MWVFVAFDLPTTTKDERRIATRFRNDLLELGFSRFQYSIYSYYVVSKGIADTVATRIMYLVPANGHVSVFFITEKQFGMIRNYHGRKSVRVDPPEQGVFIF